MVQLKKQLKMVKNGENQKVIEQIDNKNKRNEQQKTKQTNKKQTKKPPGYPFLKKLLKTFFCVCDDECS